MYRAGLLIALMGLVAEPVLDLHPAQAKLGGGKLGLKHGKKHRPKGRVPAAEIKSMSVTRVDGTRVELALGLFKPGRAAKYRLEIYFVDGRRRYKLWSGEPRFMGQRGGMIFSTAVDVRGKQLRRGHLEAVVPACTREARCHKTLRLSTGDLKIARHEVDRRGRISILRATVRNAGPTRSRRCKAILKIEGHKVAEKPLPALKVGQSREVELSYPSGRSGERYEVQLACHDLAAGNNKLQARLP